MIGTYMNEIIASIAILVLIVVYILIKKSQNKKIQSHENDNIEQPEEKVILEEEIQEIEPTVVEEETKDIDIHTLSGEEEGSFGDEVHYTRKNLSSEEEPKIDEVIHERRKRVKRSVPPHAKITKDNFKEFAGQRILVAEDNLINQKVIGGLLADSGIEVTIADDGQITLDILAKDSDYNFILMDAHMPRVDGFQATRAIRENPAYDHIVVVALSGDTAADDIKKMREAGMEEQLEKPLRMEALYNILYAYSKNRSSDKESDNSLNILKTKELDTDKGLSVCGGDEDFYNEILNEFVTAYAKSHFKIRELLNDKKMKEADKYLLDISGITANIGATNLCRISLELKEAVKNPKERRYMALFKEYTKSLQNLLKDIEKYKS